MVLMVHAATKLSIMLPLDLFAGNFLVSKEPPHRPILLDFGLTKSLSSPIKRALAKMFLASVEVCATSLLLNQYVDLLDVLTLIRLCGLTSCI